MLNTTDPTMQLSSAPSLVSAASLWGKETDLGSVAMDSNHWLCSPDLPSGFALHTNVLIIFSVYQRQTISYAVYSPHPHVFSFSVSVCSTLLSSCWSILHVSLRLCFPHRTLLCLSLSHTNPNSHCLFIQSLMMIRIITRFQESTPLSSLHWIPLQHYDEPNESSVSNQKESFQ